MKNYFYIFFLLVASVAHAETRYTASFSQQSSTGLPTDYVSQYQGVFVSGADAYTAQSNACEKLFSGLPITVNYSGVDYTFTAGTFDGQCKGTRTAGASTVSWAYAIPLTDAPCPVGTSTPSLVVSNALYDSLDPAADPVALSDPVMEGCYNSCTVNTPSTEPGVLNCTSTLTLDENGYYPGTCQTTYTYTADACSTGFPSPGAVTPPVVDPLPDPVTDPTTDPTVPTTDGSTTGSGTGDSYTPSDSGTATGSGGGDGNITNPDTTAFDPDADNQATVAGCNTPVQCTGDDIACESLAIAHDIDCAFAITNPEGVASLPTVGTDPNMNTETDLSTVLQTDGGWMVAGSCPEGPTVTVLGATLNFEMSPLCTLAGWFAPMIMIIAGIISVRIIGS